MTQWVFQGNFWIATVFIQVHQGWFSSWPLDKWWHVWFLVFLLWLSIMCTRTICIMMSGNGLYFQYCRGSVRTCRIFSLILPQVDFCVVFNLDFLDEVLVWTFHHTDFCKGRWGSTCRPDWLWTVCPHKVGHHRPMYLFGTFLPCVGRGGRTGVCSAICPCVEVREQLASASSFLSPCGAWGLNWVRLGSMPTCWAANPKC